MSELRRSIAVRDKIIFIESPEMIDPHHVVQTIAIRNPLHPPFITGFFMILPFIERVSPKLPRGRERIRRASRHARRRTRFIQLEQLGICPCIGTVKRYINGDIPYNADFLFIGIRLKRQPLNGEHKLLELIKFYFVRKLFFISLHRFGFTEPDVFLPFNPAYPVKGILHRHI